MVSLKTATLKSDLLAGDGLGVKKSCKLKLLSGRRSRKIYGALRFILGIIICFLKIGQIKTVQVAWRVLKITFWLSEITRSRKINPLNILNSRDFNETFLPVCLDSVEIINDLNFIGRSTLFRYTVAAEITKPRVTAIIINFFISGY